MKPASPGPVWTGWPGGVFAVTARALPPSCFLPLNQACSQGVATCSGGLNPARYGHRPVAARTACIQRVRVCVTSANDLLLSLPSTCHRAGIRRGVRVCNQVPLVAGQRMFMVCSVYLCSFERLEVGLPKGKFRPHQWEARSVQAKHLLLTPRASLGFIVCSGRIWCACMQRENPLQSPRIAWIARAIPGRRGMRYREWGWNSCQTSLHMLYIHLSTGGMVFR
jgi:hypothetical protein